MPPSRWRVLDERSPGGGRPKAWLFLTHPGPSLLVTVTVVAAAALLGGGAPSVRTAVGLVLVMLPAQLAIGALNDWADWSLDSVAKPFKPIPRGMVSRWAALVLALACLLVSAGAAAYLGTGVLLADALAIAAGTAYDMGLKRTPAAVLAWWAGLAAIPLMAMAVIGRSQGAAALLPLAGAIALALLLANGLPDREGDRRGGARTLAAVLGVGRSRRLLSAALLGAAVYALLVRGLVGQSDLAVAAAALLGLGGALVPVLTGRRGRLAFPVLAVLSATAAISWLAALPVQPAR